MIWNASLREVCLAAANVVDAGELDRPVVLGTTENTQLLLTSLEGYEDLQLCVVFDEVPDSGLRTTIVPELESSSNHESTTATAPTAVEPFETERIPPPPSAPPPAPVNPFSAGGIPPFLWHRNLEAGYVRSLGVPRPPEEADMRQRTSVEQSLPSRATSNTHRLTPEDEGPVVFQGADLHHNLLMDQRNVAEETRERFTTSWPPVQPLDRCRRHHAKMTMLSWRSRVAQYLMLEPHRRAHPASFPLVVYENDNQTIGVYEKHVRLSQHTPLPNMMRRLTTHLSCLRAFGFHTQFDSRDTVVALPRMVVHGAHGTSTRGRLGIWLATPLPAAMLDIIALACRAQTGSGDDLRTAQEQIARVAMQVHTNASGAARAPDTARQTSEPPEQHQSQAELEADILAWRASFAHHIIRRTVYPKSGPTKTITYNDDHSKPSIGAHDKLNRLNDRVQLPAALRQRSHACAVSYLACVKAAGFHVQNSSARAADSKIGIIVALPRSVVHGAQGSIHKRLEQWLATPLPPGLKTLISTAACDRWRPHVHARNRAQILPNLRNLDHNLALPAVHEDRQSDTRSTGRIPEVS